jgi:DMSO/TMAO reductase YedYZ molybdopterin-dependent catalytic subunit
MIDRSRAAVAGGLAAATSLAISELVAGVVSFAPSLVQEIGDVFIDNVPTGLKDWAISVFGIYDKLALIIGIVVVSIGLGAAVGVVAKSRLWLAFLVFVFAGLGGATAAVIDGESPVGAAVAGGLAAGAGIAVLAWLYRRIERTAPSPDGQPRYDADRRAFITGVGAVVAVAAFSVGAGRILMDRARQMVAGRESVALPVPGASVAPPAPAASLAVNGLSPLVTPNQDFYRIDTALSVPRVDLSTWTLSVHGMVDRPYEITFDQLLDMEMVERYVTLSCVSNEVGGHLVGNAKWLGVPLGEVLQRAGVQEGAGQVVGRSVDGFTVGFPTEAIFDGRDALLAVGMNDEPLPFDHGFPARLVVAGLYGYVSATKWLSDIELTTWDAFDAYWVPRGWSKRGPVKTQSRIDTPRRGAQLGTEPRAIAGVAWAPNLGIERVEVQVDEGDWVEAELAASLDQDSWRQWMVAWSPSEGDHVIRVRATDGSGYTQTEEMAPPAPDGATGWHTIRVAASA